MKTIANRKEDPETAAAQNILGAFYFHSVLLSSTTQI